MNPKAYILSRLVTIIVVAALGIWAVATGNRLILIPVLIAGIAIMFLFSRRVKK
ncbi:hypothetical protein ACFLWU_06655 [Chloroflexota bacterium]